MLFQAPLGTYLGWNIVASGFFQRKYCGFTGGYMRFAMTTAQRLASGDPRRSLEERYGGHDNYVAAVAAADSNLAQGFLLQADHDSLIAQAQASNVCTFGSAKQSCDPAAP